MDEAHDAVCRGGCDTDEHGIECNSEPIWGVYGRDERAVACLSRCRSKVKCCKCGGIPNRRSVDVKTTRGLCKPKPLLDPDEK